jgi:hypothetical protein
MFGDPDYVFEGVRLDLLRASGFELADHTRLRFGYQMVFRTPERIAENADP